MNDATPREVATQFGIAAALSFSAMAAPFVPEAILAYAGYRYLRHFTYRWRTWRAPARVPLHLGRRGYRDETTRRRGDASWPIGLCATGQVWLRREDLVQGLVIQSDDQDWQTQATANLVFGACLNGTGAIVVQSADTPMLTGRLAEVAAPFGRDGELKSLDLMAVPQQQLRIAISTLASALGDLRLGFEAEALNQALLPIIEMLAARYRKCPLALYGAFVDEVTLDCLVNGEYEIDGVPVSAETPVSSDGAALRTAFDSLQAMSREHREIGRQALVAHVTDLAGLRSVSFTDGFDLEDAVSAAGLVCIRPSSPLTTALVVARCTEALVALNPSHASHTLIHVAYPDALSGKSAKRFRAAAAQAGAVGTLSVPLRPANHIYKALRKACAIRIERKKPKRRATRNQLGRITSAVKECSFSLDLLLLEASKSSRRAKASANGA